MCMQTEGGQLSTYTVGKFYTLCIFSQVPQQQRCSKLSYWTVKNKEGDRWKGTENQWVCSVLSCLLLTQHKATATVRTHTHTNRKHGGTPGMEHIVLLRPIKGNREFSLLKKKHYLYLSVPFYSEGADWGAKNQTHWVWVWVCACACVWERERDVKGSWFFCPDTKPWAQTGSFTHSLYDLCVFEPDSWTSVLHKHPSWLIILSSVSILIQLRTPPPLFPFHRHTDWQTSTHLYSARRENNAIKSCVIDLWLVNAPLDSVNTVQPQLTVLLERTHTESLKGTANSLA